MGLHWQFTRAPKRFAGDLQRMDLTGLSQCFRCRVTGAAQAPQSEASCWPQPGSRRLRPRRSRASTLQVAEMISVANLGDFASPISVENGFHEQPISFAVTRHSPPVLAKCL